MFDRNWVDARLIWSITYWLVLLSVQLIRSEVSAEGKVHAMHHS